MKERGRELERGRSVREGREGEKERESENEGKKEQEGPVRPCFMGHNSGFETLLLAKNKTLKKSSLESHTHLADARVLGGGGGREALSFKRDGSEFFHPPPPGMEGPALVTGDCGTASPASVPLVDFYISGPFNFRRAALGSKQVSWLPCPFHRN